MNLRDRFRAIMAYESYDHVPLWFFGTWFETKKRWYNEGLAGVRLNNDIDAGPFVPGMDADWEEGMWEIHGLANPQPRSAEPEQVL
jgi:hypothetical protein